jgi:hypothetical protein
VGEFDRLWRVGGKLWAFSHRTEAVPSYAIILGLIATYAVASRCRVRGWNGSSVPTQVVLVPMFVLAAASSPYRLRSRRASFLARRRAASVIAFRRNALVAVTLSAWHAVGADRGVCDRRRAARDARCAADPPRWRWWRSTGWSS